VIDEIASVERRADRLRRRRQRRRIIGLVLLAAMLAAGGIVWMTLGGADEASQQDALYGTPAQGPQIVTLVAMQLHDAPNARADSLTLMGVDRTGNKPVVVFIPTRTLTQVPAFAYTSIGDALIDTPFLQRISLENMMGISVDNIVTLDDVALGKFIAGLGGLDITVDQDVYVLNENGGKELAYQHGSQHMEPAVAVTYMTDVGEDQTEIDRFPRQRAIWEAILAQGPARIRDALGALESADIERASRDALAEVLTAMAAGDPIFETLPADPVVVGGGDESYRIDATGLDAMVSRDFPSSTFGVKPSERIPLEIRNGAGVPGAGERAAALLIEDGFKVAVAANAKSFRFDKTTITVHGQDDAARALGEQLKTLLGGGEVRLAPQGQTVVRATIVVGRDLAGP
jgi:anionic cell wall polymer biosynthesis LytR-Cps2A-Psr (LCP) family protein